ncbi:AraC family transcriptional regulator [Paenibacillus paeoniae]|uniref:Helix-turn-helix domain-containing protein n=1 Tax=Paenibacillus paeoniae TaxID=2292705 RepID=A0A371PMY6_9BACL|nr:AraC family transcriptional regulator [Paenibacillus paeoniae]REK77570.1 helix-turn-helix domain-containing protein [Paenibacillus paeoniae]
MSTDSHNIQDKAMCFVLDDVSLLVCRREDRLLYRTSRHHIIVFFASSGRYRISNTERQIDSGLCLLLPPGCEIELIGSAEEVQCHRISFDVWGWGEEEPLAVVDEGWPYTRPITVTDTTLLLDAIQRLQSTQTQQGSSWRMRQAIALQEWICLLLEQYEQSVGRSVFRETDNIRMTIRYLAEHYTENISVNRLANMAGMERAKYSAAFQLYMGKKPLEYVNSLRIEKAMKLLDEFEQPLRVIARQVGFSDEYYFSKRFTQYVGLPPRMYANISRSAAEELLPANETNPSYEARRIVITGSMLGELLALGIKPVGAELTIIKSQVVYRDLLQEVTDVGTLGEPSRIAALCPDLIVLSCKLNRYYNQLLSIAPTVILDNNLQTWERLLSVAELVGKQEEAEAWITGYEKRWGMMWESLHADKKLHETAVVLLLFQGQLYLMGNSGFAVSLYHANGFLPPDCVMKLMTQGEAFRKVSVDTLSHLDGDRLFLLTDFGEIDNQNVEWLMNTQGWQAMDAVKRGCVHMVESSWNYDDPVTRDRLLSVLPTILRFHSADQVTLAGCV